MQSRTRFYERGGEIIRALRESRDLSRKQFCVIAGISSTLLQKLETGRSCLSLWNAYYISKKLKISIHQLIPEDPREGSVVRTLDRTAEVYKGK